MSAILYVVVNMVRNVHMWSVTLKCRIEAALQISSTEGPDFVATESVHVHVRCAVLSFDAVVCCVWVCGESW